MTTEAALLDKQYHIGLGPPLQGKIPPGDPYWREFNGAFKNRELTQLDLAAELYDGRPITTCCDPPWRKGENYHLGQHLGLDFDTEDRRSTFSYLMRDSFIGKYGSLLYTTPSHTPDKPRARVIFMLDQPIHQAINYTMAATALLWIFGTADPKCKDPVRFFYGCKPGAGEMEWLNHELPLEIVKDLIKRYRATGQASRRRMRKTLPDYDNQPTDKQRIVHALSHINPWSIDYDEWVAILMAIHSEMPGPSGLSLADQWADGKLGEVEHKWRSFDANGNTMGKITIATLFAVAKEHGWEPER